MAEVKLSILIFIFSNILSLVATFLGNPSTSLDWPAIITLRVTLVVTLVVRPLLLVPSLILLRTIVVVVDEVHILMGFRAIVP